MSIDAGKLRHRVMLQARQEIIDPVTGARDYAWVDVGKMWASVEPLSARDFVAANAVQSQVTARITIRHRDDVTAGMRIAHQGKLYDITGVLADRDSGREYLTLPCAEGASAG